MNEYETKQLLRKQRYANLAEQNQKKAIELAEYDQQEMEHSFPFGQPILVGHHSERRQRNALKKSEARMHKAKDLFEKAEYYEQKANTTSTAISSDDPDAIKKLYEKLSQLEERHALMKHVNQVFRKSGLDAVMVMELPKDMMALMLQERKFKTADEPPFTYHIPNSNACIKSTKARINALENKKTANPKPDIFGNGFIIQENLEENRIMLIFENKPTIDVRIMLKKRGFKWSPTKNAWIRMLNENSRLAARGVLDVLDSSK